MKSRNRLLEAFGEPALAALSPHLSETALSLDRVLGEAGDAVDHVYFPSSGVVSMITLLDGGRMVESLTVGREGAVGLLPALGRPAWSARALVQMAGTAWRVTSRQLREAALGQPAILDVALRYAQATEAHLYQSSACNAAHALEARLCRWLLTCEDRVGDHVLPLTQNYLAMMLGVQRTSVTVAAQAVQRKGLVQYRRGRITILDRAGLEAAACGCYRTTEDAYAALLGDGAARAR
jgi:CRP-like cAMP-binding protein